MTAPIWQYERMVDWNRPTAPTREVVRRGFAALLDQLRGKNSDRIEAELQRVPQFLLERATPAIEFDEAAVGLETALEGWLGVARPTQYCRLIVGPPGDGIATTLRTIAEKHNATIVSAPGGMRLLQMDENLLRDKLNSRGMIVIPRLENWFLRHQDGLRFIRQIVEWTENTETPCLIGCDSWAWAYLDKALRIGSVLPKPMTLKAFDAADLQQWLGSMAQQIRRGHFHFRKSDSGVSVLDASSDHDEQTSSYFLRQLAAASRGIPGIAWALWRHSLRVTPAEGANVDTETMPEKGVTLWVDPWEEVDLPIVTNSNTEGQFILHALLLHNGLTSESLDFILPFSFNQVRQELARLEDARLVEKDVNHMWRVAWVAYPNVRQELYDEGYLVDHF